MTLAAGEYGMNIDRNPTVTFGNFNAPQAAVHRACEELYTRVQREKGGEPQLLMFFVKGKSAIMYEHVKQWCDTIKGVHSQAVDGGNVITKGGDRAFHANLLLKINTKLGGTTVALQYPLTSEKHPTVYSHGGPNVRCILGLMSPMQLLDLNLLLLRRWWGVLIMKVYNTRVLSLSTRIIARRLLLEYELWSRRLCKSTRKIQGRFHFE
jgi:hypothetical protein